MSVLHEFRYFGGCISCSKVYSKFLDQINQLWAEARRKTRLCRSNENRKLTTGAWCPILKFSPCHNCSPFTPLSITRQTPAICITVQTCSSPPAPALLPLCQPNASQHSLFVHFSLVLGTSSNRHIQLGVWNAFSGTARIMRLAYLLSLFSPVLHWGLYVVEHEEVQRYDLCVYYGARRIGLWDLILWKWQSSRMCQTLTGRQAEWSCSETERESGGKTAEVTLSVMWVLNTLCNFSFLSRGRSEWLQTCGFTGDSI